MLETISDAEVKNLIDDVSFPVEVTDLIGKGGQKQVYHAICTEKKIPAVFKVLKPSRDTLARVKREIRAVDIIKHPNIPKILETNVANVNDPEELIWIVEEFIDGKCLRDILKEGKTFTLAEVIEFVDVMFSVLEKSDESIKKHIERLHPTEIIICSVVKAELFAGACKSQNKNKTIEKLNIFFAPIISILFDDEAAVVYGNIRANLEKTGIPIGPYDLQIASIAVLNDLILVTHNVREFSRVEALKIEDWKK